MVADALLVKEGKMPGDPDGSTSKYMGRMKSSSAVILSSDGIVMIVIYKLPLCMLPMPCASFRHCTRVLIAGAPLHLLPSPASRE